MNIITDCILSYLLPGATRSDRPTCIVIQLGKRGILVPEAEVHLDSDDELIGALPVLMRDYSKICVLDYRAKS